MIQPVSEPSLIAGYLSDESGITGHAEGIFFPKSRDEAAQAVQFAAHAGKTITVQGARTGFCGDAVPHGGYVLNLSRLDRLLSFRFDPALPKTASITVQAGVTLDAINQALQTKSPALIWADAASQESWTRYRESGIVLFFPPNPTEGSASLGGILTTEAAGSHRYAYGSVRSQIAAVEYAQDGSSVVTACTLRLAVKPAHVCSLLTFGPDYPALLHFLHGLERCPGGRAVLTGADFFDRSCFELAREQVGRTAALSQIPDCGGACAALCLELSSSDEEALFALLENALTALEEAGLDPAAALAATTAQEVRRMQGTRHALTETANLLSCGRPKFIAERTLDAVEADEYPRLLGRLSDALAAAPLSGLLFGYAGLRNFHLRLLPDGTEQERLAAQFLADNVPAAR